MGASISVYWPGITEEQLDRQPGFYNDDKAWGDFMAEREDAPDVKQLIVDLGAGPILTVSTEGMGDDDIYWVTPEQLYDAASRLHMAVQQKRPEIERILAIYARNANRIEPVEEEFCQDLEDIKTIARWAQAEGAQIITLEVNW